MWIDPSRKGQNMVWRKPCLPDIIKSLVSSTNPQGKIKNSNLDLAGLVLQEDTLLETVPNARMAAPCSGLDNTHTVSSSTREPP